MKKGYFELAVGLVFLSIFIQPYGDSGKADAQPQDPVFQ